MAEFVAPQFNNPDFLRSAALGQQMGIQAQLAPGELQGQQQGLQQGQLTIDQLRQTLQTKGLINQYAQKLASQDDPNGTQSAQAAGGGTGGIQNGPQGSLTQPATPGGPSTGTMMALDVLQGRDPLQTQRFAQENQLAQKKLQLAGPINLAVQVAQDPRANVVIANNPSMLGGFKQWAAAHGLDPNDPTNLTVANAQAAAKQLYSNLKAQVGESGNDLGFSGTLKPGEEAYKNGQAVAGDPNGMTADQRANLEISRGHLDIDKQKLKLQQANQGAFTPEMGELGAALAERGVSLPSGFRSKQQQASLYGGLLARHPGMSTDDLADLVKSGKISLAGDMKEQTTAGGIVGKVKYAENELTQSIPLALESSGKVSRASFVPFNKLTQMADTSISDPALVDLKIKTQSVLNAYDMLASRSGTDVGKREETKKLLSTAQSPEAYETALKAMAQEAQVAHKAGDISMGRTPGASSSGNGPVKVSSPDEAMKLAPGTVFITPDGRTKVR